MSLIIELAIYVMTLVWELAGIPYRLGERAGGWVIRRFFPQWPKTDVSKPSWRWWLCYMAWWLVVFAFTASTVVVISRPFQELQLQLGPAISVIAVFIMLITVIFTAGFTWRLLESWYFFRKESKRQTSPPVNS